MVRVSNVQIVHIEVTKKLFVKTHIVCSLKTDFIPNLTHEVSVDVLIVENRSVHLMMLLVAHLKLY